MKKQLNRSELLGSLPVKRAVLMQILPAIASQMVALAYGIADTYFVGRSYRRIIEIDISLEANLPVAKQDEIVTFTVFFIAPLALVCFASTLP